MKFINNNISKYKIRVDKIRILEHRGNTLEREVAKTLPRSLVHQLKCQSTSCLPEFNLKVVFYETIVS